MLPPTVYAVGTAAGVDISNTATVSFTDPDGTLMTVNSNTSLVRVDEILDVTIAVNDGGNVAATSPSSDNVLSFTVTNTGNGSETYALSFDGSLGGDSFNPANVRIYLDNGDGLFNPATDVLHVAGGNDLLLARDSSRVVFVVSDMPAGLSNGNTGLVRLLAEAVTAQATAVADLPGTVFGGQGTNGSDAVVGNTQADATAQNGYVVSLVATTLTKSASVQDPYGGGSAIPGATITYTLSFGVTGVGDLAGAQIVDAIPVGTTYVAGSLTLNGSSRTDIADADEGRFTGTRIEVDLGTVSAPATHTVTFRVTINSN